MCVHEGNVRRFLHNYPQPIPMTGTVEILQSGRKTNCRSQNLYFVSGAFWQKHPIELWSMKFLHLKHSTIDSEYGKSSPLPPLLRSPCQNLLSGLSIGLSITQVFWKVGYFLSGKPLEQRPYWESAWTSGKPAVAIIFLLEHANNNPKPGGGGIITARGFVHPGYSSREQRTEGQWRGCSISKF